MFATTRFVTMGAHNMLIAFFLTNDIMLPGVSACRLSIVRSHRRLNMFLCLNPLTCSTTTSLSLEKLTSQRRKVTA